METHAKADKEILTNKRTPYIDIHKMISLRLNGMHVRVEDNPSYKIAMEQIDKFAYEYAENNADKDAYDIIYTAVDALLDMTEKTAYLQGMYDCLSHFLGCSTADRKEEE